jgi:hypothetical protein
MSKKHKTQDPEALFVRALDRIARDPATRRELLWVRAMERGDAPAVASIERVDPGVADRLEPLALRILECALPPADIDDPGIRRELYLRIHDERFRHHCARFAREPCGCIECTGLSFAEQGARDAGLALN